MRKAISIFLLSLFGLNSIGLYPIFKLIQLHAKEVAGQIIKRHCTGGLVVFTDIHNNKEVVWDEENKEFSYHGKMYDVAKEETTGGILLYYCYDDEKESDIVSRIDKLVTGQAPGNNTADANTVAHFLMLLAQVFIPGGSFSFSQKGISGTSKILHSFYFAGCLSCILEILPPPPWQ